MKAAIIKTEHGYYAVVVNAGQYWSLDLRRRAESTPWGAAEVTGPAPSLEAAKRRITRAGLTWEPEPPGVLTAWQAARLAGVTYPTIINWVSRGRLIPATTYPEPVTFTRRAVEKAMAERKDVKAGRPRKEGKQ